MNTFEKEVRKALIDKEMSMADLAKALNISAAYLYDIFKGARPGRKQIDRIVELLNLSSTHIYERSAT